MISAASHMGGAVVSPPGAWKMPFPRYLPGAYAHVPMETRLLLADVALGDAHGHLGSPHQVSTLFFP